jgi:hypothetical protein
MQSVHTTVGDWLDVVDPAGRALSDHDWWLQRLKRQHALQVVVDVIAHTQNVPLRLLRSGNLKRLDRTFADMLQRQGRRQQFTTILAQHGPKAARDAALKGIDALGDPSHVATLRDWVLSLGTDMPQDRPLSLPEHYESWFLDLLPHLEREVWLTDMGNPHPAHSLARMLEHWSLYTLMWAWKHVESIAEPNPAAEQQAALGTQHFDILFKRAYFRAGRTDPGRGHDIWMLCGPFDRSAESDAGGVERVDRPAEHWFYASFDRFIGNVGLKVPTWHDIRDKAPTATELLDAFASRATLSRAEARRRLDDACAAMDDLRKVELHPSAMAWPDDSPGRTLSRANWESVAALGAWFSRWRASIRDVIGTDKLRLEIPGHRLSLLVHPRPDGDGGAHHVTIVDAKRAGGDAVVSDAIDFNAMRLRLRSPHVETPQAFMLRARERQLALWASQASAVSSLLARYSRRDRPVGADEVPGTSGSGFEVEEVDHLLRGYAGRVCQYLMQMARADNASVMWLDYSSDPATLRHVGGADRLIQHRAERESRFQTFARMAWLDAAAMQVHDPGTTWEIWQRGSQLYRAVAQGVMQPLPPERRIKTEGRGQIRPFFGVYAEPAPEDSISVPLLVHGRVVGAISIAGISSPRQFDPRLRAPLRLVAQQLAQAMATQAQLWQMRRLNWLASHLPLEQWRQHSSVNNFNPLQPVAAILANVFLCPVVHIWLRDPQNERRFKLHGYTRADLLMPAEGRLPAAPSFDLDDVAPDSPAPLSRHFAAFAVDQWSQRRSGDGATCAGNFVQARLVRAAAPVAGGGGPRYCLAEAERGTLVLDDSFIEAADAPDYRRAIFERGRLTQCMAFALVDASAADARPVGVVSLYANSPSDADHPMPWPSDWRPLVAHIQSYLPYVLMQTEAIANPLDHMRRYLLHEGRNELNHVVALASSLQRDLHSLLAVDAPAGLIRPWLRHNGPRVAGMVKSGGSKAEVASLLSECVRVMDQLEGILDRSAESVVHLASGEFAENLAVMARLIGNQRNLAQFGDPNTDPDFDHATEWFSPRERLQAGFDSYRGAWQQLNIKPDLDGVPRALEFLTSPRFWTLLTRDLIHNMAKYALPNEPIRVVWEGQGREGGFGVLRLSNFSTYAPLLDTPSRLGAFGARGSAPLRSSARSIATTRASGVMREGQGIGLWGAIEIAKVLGMELAIDVKARSEGTAARPRGEAVARYTFAISVPARLCRRGRGL